MEYLLAVALMGTGYYLSNNQDDLVKDAKITNNKNIEPNSQDIYSSNQYNKVQNIERNLVKKNVKTSMDFPFNDKNIVPDPRTIDWKAKQNKLKKIDYKNMYLDNNNNSDVIVSSLTGQPMKKEEFKVEGMVPFFGSQSKQNTYEYANQSLLSNHTGVDEYFKNKSENAPLFNPQENMTFPHGTPINNDNIKERFVPAQTRQNEAPIQPIHVGPGLNQGYTWKPSGGFQQPDTREYTMPKNTDELRTLNNPKQSYYGRVISGKKIAKPGMMGTMKKNLPDTFYVNSPDRYFTSVGAVTGRKQDPEIVLKYQNRPATEKPYTGSAAPAVYRDATKRPNVKLSTNKVYKTSGPRNLFNKENSWSVDNDWNDYGKVGISNKPNERDTTQDYNPLVNLVSWVKAVTMPLQDVIKTTRKENFIGNMRQTGNMQYPGPKKITVYDPNDIARTTIKETNIHNTHKGSLSGPIKLTTYDPNDITRTTIKETNIHNSHTGNMGSNRPSQLPAYDPNDVTRTTIKETNIHNNHSGNMGSNRPSQLPAYDPNDVTRTTIKETNIHDTRTGYMGSNRPSQLPAYDPNDVTRTTIKETNIHDTRTGYMGGNQPSQLPAYDPNDVTRTTIKETNIHDTRTGYMGGNQPSQLPAYDPNDVTRTTIKETNIHDTRTGYMGGNQPSQLPAYDPNDVTRTTIKETNIHDTRTGYMGGNQPSQLQAYDPNDVTRTTIKETNIHDTRTGYMGSNQPSQLPAYDPNDVTRTTIKQTNIHDTRTGYMGGNQPSQLPAYDPNDVTRTTIKETNIHDNRTGNMGSNHPSQLPAYDPNDVTRTTIKETNIHDNRTGNMGSNRPSQLPAYDPNDVTRTTIKETNIHDTRTGYMGGNQPSQLPAYDPNDVTRTTIKETNIHDNRTGNMQSMDSRPTARDPDDIARTTLKETIENYDTDLNVKTRIPKPTVYDPTDIAKTTIKETNINNEREGNVGMTDYQYGLGYLTNPIEVPNTNKQFTSDIEYTGQANSEANDMGGYLVTEVEAPNTNKQFTSDIDYTGIAGATDSEKPMSYSNIYNAHLNETKELTSIGRTPTQSNVTLSVGENQINMEVKKITGDQINSRELLTTKTYNSIPQPNICGVTTSKSNVNNQELADRLNPEILEPFKNNPYTQPLDSYAFP